MSSIKATGGNILDVFSNIGILFTSKLEAITNENSNTYKVNFELNLAESRLDLASGLVEVKDKYEALAIVDGENKRITLDAYHNELFKELGIKDN